jgi:hypothetical protein
MPKSSNKRKNGKVKKYKPKPKGISKKKLEQVLNSLKESGKYDFLKSDDVLEIRDESVLEIDDPTKKKYNVVLGESDIIEGPELSKKEDENLSGE